jgi:hypothetical protein
MQQICAIGGKKVYFLLKRGILVLDLRVCNDESQALLIAVTLVCSRHVQDWFYCLLIVAPVKTVDHACDYLLGRKPCGIGYHSAEKIDKHWGF